MLTVKEVCIVGANCDTAGAQAARHLGKRPMMNAAGRSQNNSPTRQQPLTF